MNFTRIKQGFQKSIRAFGNYIWLIFYTIALFALVLLVIRFFVISPGRVNGRSMEPNFIDNDLFFVNKYVYWFKKPERYEIVQVIDVPNNKLYLKRIIGLPGELVTVKRGKVYIKKDPEESELVLDESKYLSDLVYTKTDYQQGPAWFFIPPDYYFVLGDNRMHSGDSRSWGPVHRSTIIGRVIK
ncbi:MAG: signal peptidase I [bacterium]